MLWMLINLHDFACQFYWSAFHAGIKGTLYQTVFLQLSLASACSSKTSLSQRTFTLQFWSLVNETLNIQGQRHTVLKVNYERVHLNLQLQMGCVYLLR